MYEWWIVPLEFSLVIIDAVLRIVGHVCMRWHDANLNNGTCGGKKTIMAAPAGTLVRQATAQNALFDIRYSSFNIRYLNSLKCRISNNQISNDEWKTVSLPILCVLCASAFYVNLIASWKHLSGIYGRAWGMVHGAEGGWMRDKYWHRPPGR